MVVEAASSLGSARGLKAPDGAPTFDLRGLWLMPGVIDCHEPHGRLHGGCAGAAAYAALVLHARDRRERCARRSSRGHVRARRRRRRRRRQARVENGLVTGPRLQSRSWCSARPAATRTPSRSASASSPTPSSAAPSRPLSTGSTTCASSCAGCCAPAPTASSSARAAASTLPSTRPRPGFTAEEIATAVFEAGRCGKPVMSHAIAGDGIDLAVAAGVRSIEHGTMLTERQAAAMAAAGCWLVPDAVHRRRSDPVDAHAQEREAVAAPPTPQEGARAARLVRPVRAHRSRGGRAHRSGCDWIDRRQHGRNLGELPLLHEAGLSVEETLLAATSLGPSSAASPTSTGASRRASSSTPSCSAATLRTWPCSATSGTVREVFKAGSPVAATATCWRSAALAGEREPGRHT